MSFDPQKSSCCAVARPSKSTTQQRPQNPATDSATATQRISLKALAGATLRRNESRNYCAIECRKPAQQMGQKSALFDADCCAPVASEIGPSPSGNDHPPANDPDDQVGRLKAAPSDWDWWRHHFLKQLRIPNEVQCIDCGHCEDTSGNLGRCLKAVPSPGAGGLWWMTDPHPCIEFSPKEAA